MSTRLRPIVVLAGEPKVGGQARLALEMWMKSLHLPVPPRGSMPEDQRLVSMFKALPPRELGGSSSLWLFREPRRVASTRSRYAQLCQYYGIGPYRTKKKKVVNSLLGPTLSEILRADRELQREVIDRQIVEASTRAMIDANQVTPQPPAPAFANQDRWGTTTWQWMNAAGQGVSNPFGQGATQAPAPPTTQSFTVSIQDTPVFRDWDFDIPEEP